MKCVVDVALFFLGSPAAKNAHVLILTECHSHCTVSRRVHCHPLERCWKNVSEA